MSKPHIVYNEYKCHHYTERIMIRLTKKDTEKLHKIAEETQTKFSDTLRNILLDYIAKYEEEKGSEL